MRKFADFLSIIMWRTVAWLTPRRFLRSGIMRRSLMILSLLAILLVFALGGYILLVHERSLGSFQRRDYFELEDRAAEQPVKVDF